LSLETHDCIVIEDSISGLKSAFNAGIGWIYALGSTQQHFELRNSELADVVISQIDEIPRDIFRL
jgi:beta-phosphoglucomutase-like phosphatase (HAD superfamily)